MTTIHIASPVRKSWHPSDLPLLVALSVGGLIISLLLTALTWADGPFVAP